jgi:archaeosine synthase beta-subunit
VSASQYLPKRPYREPRNPLDPKRPYAMLVENERNRRGDVESVGTIFLTNRECPYQCIMCDLWKNTLRETVRIGEIPLQIEYAIAALPQFDSVKLYNSGNFFDPRAIPPEDYPRIAELVRGYSQVIVENHPRLCYEACREFASSIAPAQLEVAIGLETCHAPSLAWMNKSMTLDDFDWALERLHKWNIKTRVFLLLGLPHMSLEESLDWTMRSIEYAAARGVDCFSIIPTRPTLEPLRQLVQIGSLQLALPETIEAVMEQAIPRNLGRVLIDLWDAASFFPCEECRAARIARLEAMNLQQVVLPSVECVLCGRTAS